MAQPFTVEEVEAALKQMGPLKAPGSDSFPAVFFQKHWKIVGPDVSNFVLNNKQDPKNINHTLIALIPKLKSPSQTSPSFAPLAYVM